jgi:carboxypeptidase Taq
MKSYAKLTEKFDKMANLYNATAILNWDQSVMMPEHANEGRANQLATIYSICHNLITEKETEELLTDTEQNEKNTLNQWEKANLRVMRSYWVHANAVPDKLNTEFTVETSKCEMIWRKAKPENDFKSFAESLKKVLKLSREIATLKADYLNLSKYNALLDGYDTGRRFENFEPIFEDLKKFLPNFIANVVDKQKSRKKPIKPEGIFAIDKQKKLAEIIMQKIGFDFKSGRLDVSAHPFCGGNNDDVRITTRYDEKDFTKSLMSVMHETGHAMYNFGLPKEYKTQPVGNDLGMTIHESQSLLVEMQVCRTMPFIKFLTPIAKEIFGDIQGINEENLLGIYTEVKPDFIRVDADEVTYPLHVIIRYEIEKALIEGEMQVDDLPQVWNTKYKDYLGLDVPNNTLGCMQDIHWSGGSFGYFPTYTLGAMTAAQFYKKAKLTIPELENQISTGNFSNLMNWLHENIHNKGQLYLPDELIENVTGKQLNFNDFKDYLVGKYSV